MLVKIQNEIILEFEKVQGCNKYVVYGLCDSYIGCDQAEEITTVNVAKNQE